MAIRNADIMPNESTSSMDQVLQLPELLAAILSHLSKADLFVCAHVCHLWSPVALSFVYGHLRRPLKVCSTPRTLQLFNSRRAQELIGKSLTALEITRATSTLFSELPSIAPRLRSLTITPTATFPAKLLAMVLPALGELEIFKVINQETAKRSYPPRRSAHPPATPGYNSNNALCHLAAARGFGALKPGLSTFAAVACPDLLDDDLLQYLAPQAGALQGCGDSLREAIISSCGSISPAALRHLVQYAPKLQHLELKHLDVDEEPYVGQEEDSISDAVPVLPFGHTSLSLLISSVPLRCLTLSSLHTAQCDSSFRALSSMLSLTSLTLVNMPDFTTTSLLLFPHVQHLTITSCPNIRYVPVSRSGELQELRVLSFLGSPTAYIDFENFWELCSLGKGESVRPGLGKRGLRRLVIDSASSAPGSAVAAEQGNRISGHILPHRAKAFATRPIQSPTISPTALFDALMQADDLEFCAVYGSSKRLSDAQVRSICQRNRNLCRLVGF